MERSKVILLLILLFSAHIWALRVVSTYPQDGQINVPLDVVIKIRFDSPIKDSYLNDWYFSLKIPETYIQCNVSKNPNDPNEIFIKPISPLEENKKYTLIIKPDITAETGEKLRKEFFFSFYTVVKQDTIPPIVLETFPSVGDKVLSLSEIKVVFSETLSRDSLDQNAITLKNSKGIRIPGKIVWIPEELTLKFIPFTSLPPDMYTITVSGKLADEAGNKLGTPISWSFWLLSRSASNTVFDAKLIKPKPNSNIDSLSTIEVLFSAPVEPETLNSTTVAFFADNEPIYSKLLYNMEKQILYITPFIKEIKGKSFKLVLSSDITDLTGRHLSEKIWRFFSYPKKFQVQEVKWSTNSVTVIFTEPILPATVNWLTVRLIASNKLIRWKRAKVGTRSVTIKFPPTSEITLLVRNVLAKSYKKLEEYAETKDFRKESNTPTPPKVKKYYPTGKVVLSSTTIRVIFEDEIEASKDIAVKFKVYKLPDITPVIGKVTTDKYGVYFKPLLPLKTGKYMVRLLPHSVKSKDGVWLQEEVRWEFEVIR